MNISKLNQAVLLQALGFLLIMGTPLVPVRLLGIAVLIWGGVLYRREKKRPKAESVSLTSPEGKSLQGQEYRSAFKLYSEDGKRSVDVLEFRNGETFLDEQEWIEGTTFKNKNSGRLVGPFASPEAAEKFVVATPWFCGTKAP